MMNHPTPSRLQQRLGSVVLAALIVTTTAFAWATQSPIPAADSVADRQPSFARVTPPKYPEQAARDGIGGSVLLEIGIDTDGLPSIINVVASQPPGVFDAAASAAAAKWTFEPALKGGIAIAAHVRVPISFSPVENDVPAVTEPGETTLDTLQVRSPKR